MPCTKFLISLISFTLSTGFASVRRTVKCVCSFCLGMSSSTAWGKGRESGWQGEEGWLEQPRERRLLWGLRMGPYVEAAPSWNPKGRAQANSMAKPAIPAGHATRRTQVARLVNPCGALPPLSASQADLAPSLRHVSISPGAVLKLPPPPTPNTLVPSFLKNCNL